MQPIQSIDSRDDVAQGRGHAILSLKGVAAPAAPCRLLISRGSGARAEYLGAEGWQSTRAHIIPDEVREQAGQLEIHLGPAVVQHMARGNFSLTLVAGNARSEPKAFAWKVAPFRSTRDNLTIRVEDVDGDEGSAALAGSDVPAPPSPPTPSPVAAPAAATPSPLWAPPADTAASTSSGNNKKWLLIAAAVVVVLALVLGIAYWLLLGRDQAEPVAEPPPAPAVTPEPPAAVEPPVEPPPPVPDTPPVVEAPAVVAPPAVAAPPAPAAPSSAADEEVRQFLATNPSVDAIIAKADEMLQREQPGLALTLYRRASDAGSADALVSLARLYDPSASSPGMAEKRPQFAYNFYRQALAQGHADAATAIAQLKQWANEQAATGNREAAQLLRLIALEN